MAKNLFQKVWDDHVVGRLDNGQYQVFMALHLIHEVTSPQAFGMLKDKGLGVAFPKRTFATVDHIIPTDTRARPLQDDMAEKMMAAHIESRADVTIAAIPVPAEEASRFGVLETTPEGWITGLQLAALSLQERDAEHVTSFGQGNALKVGKARRQEVHRTWVHRLGTFDMNSLELLKNVANIALKVTVPLDERIPHGGANAIAP